MTAVAVFDLDKVLLGGDATTLFLRGRLRQAPHRVLGALLAAPALLPGAAVPGLRPLSARLLTRITVGGRSGDDVAAVAEAYRAALARVPEAAVGDALARVRVHRAAGDRVVVATGCEETLARGYLTAIGLDDVDVVGSTGLLWPPRSARAIGEAKVRMLVARGYPPPWTAVYSDSASDLPLFAGTPRPVLVNGGPGAARQVGRVLGRPPETVTWR
jgi:phosphatidylglycerophosphatase C